MAGGVSLVGDWRGWRQGPASGRCPACCSGGSSGVAALAADLCGNAGGSAHSALGFLGTRNERLRAGVGAPVGDAAELLLRGWR